MFKYIKLGERELLEPIEMPDSAREVLTEILAQNRMILEANCMAMRLICQPSTFKMQLGDADGE